MTMRSKVWPSLCVGPVTCCLRSVVGIASAERRVEPAISIPSAVRENAVTRMAIATLALYSAPQPL